MLFQRAPCEDAELTLYSKAVMQNNVGVQSLMLSILDHNTNIPFSF